MMLEGKQCMCPDRLMQFMFTEAKFLTLLNGRGGLYAFLGTLLLSQWPQLFDVLLGFYMVFIGVLMILVGSHAKGKMEVMKSHLTDEETVRTEFEVCVLIHHATMVQLSFLPLASDVQLNISLCARRDFLG